MSVPKYQRSESNVQFVTKAAALEAAVGAMCARLPKRWTETRARHITDCASDVLKNAVRANAIWPKTEDDLARREGHIQEAVGACQELQARLDALLVARPMKAVKDKDGETTRMVPCVPDGLLDAALAALAAERMSLWERAGPADWGDPPRRGPMPHGTGAMGVGAFGCPLSAWKGTAWEIARAGESGEKRGRARR